MWVLLKTEFRYNYPALAVSLIIPIGYTIYLIIGHPYLDEEASVSKIIWPMLIGFASLLFVAKTYAARVISKRDNLFMLLPVNLKGIIISRILYGLIPYLIILFYLIIVHKIVLVEWPGITSRIFYQFGVNGLLASSLAFTYELTQNSKEKGSSYHRWIISLFMIASLIFLTEVFLLQQIPMIVPIGGNYF